MKVFQSMKNEFIFHVSLSISTFLSLTLLFLLNLSLSPLSHHSILTKDILKSYLSNYFEVKLTLINIFMLS